METHWQSASLIQHPTSASPARQQPHLAEMRRWRRQSVQMGRQICVCLSRCNPWRDISSGVGNSSAQTVDDHVLVNGRTRKRSAAGGWSEAEVCAGELPLRGRPCMEEDAAASGSVKVTFVQFTARANVPQRCLEQGFVRAVICRNCVSDNQQQHLPSNTCATDNQQHHLPPNTCTLGWKQHHLPPNTCILAWQHHHPAPNTHAPAMQ